MRPGADPAAKPRRKRLGARGPGAMVVFDTETTGLRLHDNAPLTAQPRCIEFAAQLLSMETGEALDGYATLIQPGVLLDDDILRITGLTDADLVDAPTFAQAWPEIAAVLGRARRVCAHNLPFDRGVLRGECARWGLERELEEVWPVEELCTVGAFRAEWGRNPKLTELYASLLGRPFQQQHRAMGDVEGLVEVVQAAELWRAWEGA